ncbi:MAG TPA: HAMP domain-containing sensor histidine kinase, partial [Ruminococcus flavefaciens]|nr:HAMP domain-containing sensor histidine kinase [Ruminococcus flavefaciens]
WAEVSTFFISLIVLFVAAQVFNKKISQLVEDESQRQIKERNVLFANIAHDMKNPISSVLGFSRALESGKVSEYEKHMVYKTICNKALQIDDMIKKMLNYAKLESCGYEIKRENTELCSFLRTIIAERYNEIEENLMELELEFDNGEIYFPIDKVEFTRVINNLISNVLKHNDIGTRILISIKKQKNITIAIADSGNPIEGDIHENLFKPFQCSDVSRVLKNGSGLGLAISKRIIELHGGKIILEEKIPNYTKSFIIIL